MYSWLNRSYVLDTTVIGILNIDDFHWKWNLFFDIPLLHSVVVKRRKFKRQSISMFPIKRTLWRESLYFSISRLVHRVVWNYFFGIQQEVLDHIANRTFHFLWAPDEYLTSAWTVTYRSNGRKICSKLSVGRYSIFTSQILEHACAKNYTTNTV